MVQPIIMSHSGQESRTEDSSDEARQSPLDDSGIQTDSWNSNTDSHGRNGNSEDLEGAVGYIPNAAYVQRRLSYWGDSNVSVLENGYLRPRRHSSGELSRRHRSQENRIGHSHSNHQFDARERRSSNQSQYERSEGYNTWDTSEVLNPNHNHFATQYVYPPGVPHETVIVGSQLYVRFLREEIRRLNLQEPVCLDPNHANPPPIGNNDIINIGHSLRQVANEFAHSAHRLRVREKAASVSLENLNFNTFSDLLYGLFQEGGVTSERVVVLFFFCSDLAIRALRNRLTERFDFITYWSQRYIMEKFSVWVQEQGGWAAVLQHSVNHAYKFAVISFCCVAIVTMLIYIRNNAR